mmetsp:Transcript_33620/g.79297  ORF Transcript_33620/g.79297 Transcript_33620/m.79297 type:complete len:355 (-) Transcript_33620:272-1336(-)
MKILSKYGTIFAILQLLGIVGTEFFTSAELNAPVSSSAIFSIRHRSKHDGKFTSISSMSCNDILIPQSRTNHLSNQEQQLETILSVRAGRIVRNASHSPTSSSMSSSPSVQKPLIKKGLLLVSVAAAAYGLFHTRSTWMTLFNKEKLQTSVVRTLESLNDLPHMYSRSFYTIAMALWETMGMSTIPVETAAGMVFGWSAFYWSGLGKVLGACLAFGLGRGALSAIVNEKLSSNAFLKLVQSSTDENPLLVTILIKLSCFPETVKNFGSSMLKPITWWMFVSATAVHGLTFTALWTYLGVDTAARLKDTTGMLPADQRLKTLLTLALINGIVVSPLSMAYWMRTLRQKQQEHKGR